MSANGYIPGASSTIPASDYLLKTLIRNSITQHADIMAILGGYLYFHTNRLTLGPSYHLTMLSSARISFEVPESGLGEGRPVKIWPEYKNQRLQQNTSKQSIKNLGHRSVSESTI
jgi:hypothetical protein